MLSVKFVGGEELISLYQSIVPKGEIPCFNPKWNFVNSHVIVFSYLIVHSLCSVPNYMDS